MIKKVLNNVQTILSLSIIVGMGVASSSAKINMSGWDSWIPIFLGCIIIQIGFAEVNARYDKDKTIPKIHWKRGLIRTAFFLLISFICLVYTDVPTLGIWYVSKPFMALSLFNASIFGLYFDPRLNYLRGKPWDYAGSISLWDKLDRIFPGPIIIVEAVGLVASIIVFAVTV